MNTSLLDINQPQMEGTQQQPQMTQQHHASLLRPGFRFAPTDEEIIKFYLRPKVMGEEYPTDVIQEIDVTNFEPWDLLGTSRECYYFTSLDKKYLNGKKTNRTTRGGFWKTTGRDTPIRSNGQVIGTRKILVFHMGRSKNKERTNWVMHEFSLGPQETFVISKVFLKTEEPKLNNEDTEVTGLAKTLILLQHSATALHVNGQHTVTALHVDGQHSASALHVDGQYTASALHVTGQHSASALHFNSQHSASALHVNVAEHGH